MHRAIVALLLLALGACAAPVPATAPAESRLLLPTAERMASLQWLEFHNDGPEDVILLAAGPRRIVGIARVRAGETAHVTWRGGSYVSEIKR